MITGVEILGGLIVGLGSCGALELAQLKRARARVPIRVHVNGTRGKSSVTRLIAAGLREHGIPTCAKTTGTLPRMILPDGSEFPIYRPSAPNVIEQVRMFFRAVDVGAEAVVFECMALQPFLQWLSEDKMLRATHTVLTNVRPDHLDVMGPCEEDVAWALAASMPRSGNVFTAEEKHLGILRQVARDRGATLHEISSAEIAAITAPEMAGFPYVEHPENVALALKVCTALGVARQSALQGMWKAKPDPGVLTIDEIDFFGRHLSFVNAFAANDPASTRIIWEKAFADYPAVGKRLALVNCREDRPERSQQFAEFCASLPVDHVVVVGTGVYIFAKAAKATGLDLTKMVLLADRTVADIFEIVLEHAGRSALVVGMGNIGGMGLDMVRYFHNRAAVREVA